MLVWRRGQPLDLGAEVADLGERGGQVATQLLVLGRELGEAPCAALTPCSLPRGALTSLSLRNGQE
jgi:hypothetical protein